MRNDHAFRLFFFSAGIPPTREPTTPSPLILDTEATPGYTGFIFIINYPYMTWTVICHRFGFSWRVASRYFDSGKELRRDERLRLRYLSCKPVAIGCTCEM